MVAGDGFVEVPPHALYRIGFGRIFGQEVNLDPVSPARQIFLDSLALVKGCIVTNDMDFPIAPQAAAQVVEMLEEQLRVPTLSWLADQQGAGPPM